MGIRVENATLEDTEGIAKMAIAASTAPRVALEFKDCKPDDWLDWMTAGFENAVSASSKRPDELLMVKAVDEMSGGIAGCALWGWSPEAAGLISGDKGERPLPAGTNSVLRNAYKTALHDLENQHRPSGDYYELLELVTSPSFQRQGIGSRLVTIGLEKADREGRTCFLCGSPDGAPLYRKLGFEDVGRLEIPLREYGGEGTHVHIAMIRKPKESSGV